ncbi:SET and MYND domain-containing protein DDB_G0273589-like isoform X2 [Aethina tumida]|uniref:SET and MYND domain-containing protein DDB_G0273589-like isoform X2 n=1 Tax=Aethina tumida TaxID=116153 RepID=UPI0021497EF7|nr:SET and MYND domain-containing protein DDB_G0273589-like isoform X2 [Aethina tumida]
MAEKISNILHSWCTEAIASIPLTDLDKFEYSHDNVETVKLLYPSTHKIIPTSSLASGKNITVAEAQKVKGNQFYGKKDLKNALAAYNEGIIVCPQDTDAGKKLLSILISNRSAVNFENNEHRLVLKDIHYMSTLNSYPDNLLWKVRLRQARSYDALRNTILANKCYDEAVDLLLKHADLDDKTKKAKQLEIETLRKKGMKPIDDFSEDTTDFDKFNRNPQYVNLLEDVTIMETEELGRYAVAKKDIPLGSIIACEDPYASVVTASNALVNCQHCVTSVGVPVACRNCAHVVFCSIECENKANDGYHKIECALSPILAAAQASVNCCLALRIITQNPLSFFKDQYKKFKPYLKLNCQKKRINKKVYKSDDYDNLFFLCRNESSRPKSESLHFMMIASFLLKLLKQTEYFGEKSPSEKLTEIEAFIGALIYRHLEILQYNAHDISELRDVPNPVAVQDKKTYYENYTVGAGIYPTMSLFNHSCDPSLTRYNIKNKKISRSVKPIKAGDVIYENYGMCFTLDPLETRQNTLRQSYLFNCTCQACTENWPLYENMSTNINVKCTNKRCTNTFVIGPEQAPVLVCPKCMNGTVFKPLQALTLVSQLKILNGLQVRYLFSFHTERNILLWDITSFEQDIARHFDTG